MPDDRIASTDPGEIVRRARLAAGHRSIHAARLATGLAESTLYRIEHSTHGVTVDRLATILDLFGYDLEMVARRRKS